MTLESNRFCHLCTDFAAASTDDFTALLVEHAKRKRCCLVLGCDANTHHIQWGSADINILNIIILNGHNIYKAGNTPIFKNRVREAVIDIRSNMDRSMINDWRGADECYFSDH